MGCVLRRDDEGEGRGGYVSHRDTEETEAAGQARLAQRGITKKYLDLAYILMLPQFMRLRPE